MQHTRAGEVARIVSLARNLTYRIEAMNILADDLFSHRVSDLESNSVGVSGSLLAGFCFFSDRIHADASFALCAWRHEREHQPHGDHEQHQKQPSCDR